MSAVRPLVISIALGLVVPFMGPTAKILDSAAAAQFRGPALPQHIGHVWRGWTDTPQEKGFLTVASAEAQIATWQSSLALESGGDLNAMKTHAMGVLHAVDPSQAQDGPGMGYGLKKAAEGVVTHIELAARSDSAHISVTTYAPRVAACARNALERVDEIVPLVREIQAASSASQADPLVERLDMLANQVLDGIDADMDGQVGWREGGLWEAEVQMRLLMRSLPPPRPED